MSWIDQSADGRIVEWRPHILSREMSFLFRPHLEHEPVARDPETLGWRLLGVSVTPDGLRWPAGTWSRLKVKLSMADGFPGLAASRDHSITSGTWEVPWTSLPPCDALELTPVDAFGVHGVTTRVLRPPDLPWVRFKCRYELGPRPGLRLRPDRKEGLERVETVAIPLRQVAREKFRALQPVPLQAGEGFLPLGSDFGGLVAICAQAGALMRLLDCVTVAQGTLLRRPRSLWEWQEARRRVGSGDLEVPLWPARSDRPLKKILEEAEAAGVPPVLREEFRHIQAVHRHLVLRACGLETGDSTEAAILDLAQEESLQGPLARLISPELAARLQRLPEPATRLWVLRNARDAQLQELLDWAAAAGSSGLDLARRLLPFRLRLQELAAEAGRDGAEGRKIATLLKEVERAPFNLESPVGLERRLEELVKRAAKPPRSRGAVT